MPLVITPPAHAPHDSGDILRWQVESKSSSHAAYMVDLATGECACKWYRCEVAPKLRAGAKNVRLCQHYHLAKGRFCDWALWQFEQHRRQQEHGATADNR